MLDNETRAKVVARSSYGRVILHLYDRLNALQESLDHADVVEEAEFVSEAAQEAVQIAAAVLVLVKNDKTGDREELHQLIIDTWNDA